MGVDELFRIIVYVAGGFITIAGGAAIVFRSFKYFANLSELKAKVDRGEKLDDLYEIDHEHISTILEHNQKQDVILGDHSCGLQALLRNEMVILYEKYMAQGSISIIELDNIDHMYKEYKNLGGNGTIEKLIEDLRKLPIS